MIKLYNKLQQFTISHKLKCFREIFALKVDKKRKIDRGKWSQKRRVS